MSPLHVAVICMFAACFASFIWAMSGGFFRVVERTPRGTVLIQVAGALFLVAHAAALIRPGGVHGPAGIVGLGFYLASLLLFWACIRANRRRPLSLAFSADLPEHLTTYGPYRYVRHPFYTSYSLAWIAGVVASEQWWLAVSVLVMGVIYRRAAEVEERKFLASPLAAEYERYRRSTGMFLPTLHQGGARPGRAGVRPDA